MTPVHRSRQPTLRAVRTPAARFSARSRPQWTLDTAVDVPLAPAVAPSVAIGRPRDLDRRAAVAPVRLPSAELRRGVTRAPDRFFTALPAVGSAYDGCLAAGRNHLLIAENFAVAIYDKRSGALAVPPSGLGEWFPNRPAEANFVFDPRSTYDQRADRFIVAALAWKQPQIPGPILGSWLLLSVSDGADPTGDWRSWAIDTFNDPPEGWADYPCLGIDDRAVYITYNVQANPDIPARLFIFPKSDLYGEGTGQHFSIDLENADESPASSVQPCHHFGENASSYLVSTVAAQNGSEAVTLWAATWTGDTPALAAREVTIDTYRLPPKVAPQSLAKALDVGGSRVRSAVCRNNSIWFAFAAAHEPEEGAPVGAATRWYRLDGATGDPIGRGELADGDAFYVFPGLAVDRSENLVMIASRSSADEHPSLHYASWPHAGPSTTGLLIRGQGPHLKCRGNTPCDVPTARNGWGDYNGIALDPSDETTVWVFGGVGHETDKTLWATGIAALNGPP